MLSTGSRRKVWLAAAFASGAALTLLDQPFAAVDKASMRVMIEWLNGAAQAGRAVVVAERIAAGPGSKTYGILSILIQAWYKVEYLFTVHEHVFNPPPKVKSAVIRMTRNETTELGCNEKLFKLIVKTTFNQRRKTLRNSISSILDKENPLSTDPIFNKRPEQLSVQEFIELTNQVEAALKNKTDIVYSNDIARKGTNKKE